MHASSAYLNGAATPEENLDMLNTLLSGAKTPQEEELAEKEQHSDKTAGPGEFQNDPEDPSNPNEVRERHLKKVDKKLDR